MTARTTMATLISTLRPMCNAGTVDYTIAGTSYWTDDQLQTVLDRYRMQVYDETLYSQGNIGTGGTVSYQDYYSDYRNYETTSGGTAIFIVKDETHTNITTGYSVDYERGKITFTADQEGKTRYLSGYVYDLYAAAADIWGQKAGHFAEMIDFTTDGHTIKRSHQISAALAMERRYKGLSGQPGSSYMERGDT